MQRRRRFEETVSLKERLASFARDACEKMLLLRPEPQKDALLVKARQAEMTARLWANSPGLQPPK
jgi:hypothetical protein